MSIRQSKPSTAATLLIAAIASTCGHLSARESSRGAHRISFRSSDSSRAAIEVDTEIVRVPVTVTDSNNHPVTDLGRCSFRVYEDNVEQAVLSVHKEDGPVSVGFLVDTSRSMKGRIACSRAAIRQFLSTNMPGDEYFLLRFGSDSSMLRDFTSRPQDIAEALSSLRTGGWTSLNDAIYRGLDAIGRARNMRKALVVLTDGGDNYSRYPDSEVRKMARESDVRVYSIGLFTRPDFLEELGRESGGKAYWARTAADVPAIVHELSQELRGEYLLGYVPANRPMDGKYHHIKVRLVEPKQRLPLHVSWRRGYYTLAD